MNNYTDGDVARNEPLSREDQIKSITGVHVRPTCTCLRAMDTGCDSIFCAVPCREQTAILMIREKLKKLLMMREKLKK